MELLIRRRTTWKDTSPNYFLDSHPAHCNEKLIFHLAIANDSDSKQLKKSSLNLSNYGELFSRQQQQKLLIIENGLIKVVDI